MTDDTGRVPADLDDLEDLEDEPLPVLPEHDWQFAPDPAALPRMTPEEARQEARLLLIRWHGQGKAEFGIADLAEDGLAARTGRTRQWLYSLLEELEDQGLAPGVALVRHETPAGRRWRFEEAA